MRPSLHFGMPKLPPVRLAPRNSALGLSAYSAGPSHAVLQDLGLAASVSAKQLKLLQNACCPLISFKYPRRVFLDLPPFSFKTTPLLEIPIPGDVSVMHTVLVEGLADSWPRVLRESA
jgi:hypothetical protein